MGMQHASKTVPTPCFTETEDRH